MFNDLNNKNKNNRSERVNMISVDNKNSKAVQNILPNPNSEVITSLRFDH